MADLVSNALDPFENMEDIQLASLEGLNRDDSIGRFGLMEERDNNGLCGPRES